MAERANSPATKRERLLALLASRTQAEAPWRDEELAAELCCSARTVQRMRQWLRDFGKLPPPRA
ncbi:MAG: helix-turn-helix domain-containing protein [Pseudomonadota bacterium]|jgi:transcriptional regulator GlxA family with amidase domain|nr:helix-turn-helix domain-containing protein [Pseudomonadota bacterium]